MPDKLLPLKGPCVLQGGHFIESFDCGISELNDYLKKHALQSQAGRGARTYVVTRDQKVVGYFTVAYGAVDAIDSPSRMRQGLGAYPVPILVLARLAVDRQEQRKGLGRALLKQALLKALKTSDIAGLRAVLVQAKNESAKSFYERYGFVEFPSDAFRLYLLIKDIEHNMKQGSEKRDRMPVALESEITD